MQQKRIRSLMLLVLILALLPLNAFCETGSTILADPKDITITGSHERPEGYVPYYSRPLKDTPSTDELPRNAFDQLAFDLKLAQYEAFMQETDHEAELIALYEELLSDVCLAFADSAIAGFDAHHDITDLALSKKVQETSTVVYEASKAFYRANGEIMSTPYAEAFTAYWGEELAGSFAEYAADASEEDHAQQEEAAAAFLEKRQSLQQRYNTLYPSFNYYIFYEPDAEERKAIEAELKKVYVDLVSVYNDYAHSRGYTSYAEMAYQSDYSRPYTPAEIYGIGVNMMPAWENFRLKLINSMYDLGEYDRFYEYCEINRTALYEELADAVYTVNPELGEAFEHLLLGGHIDMIPYEKAGPPSTRSLYAYDDGLVLLGIQGYYRDYLSFIHEFGHYNHTLREDTPGIYQNTSMDINEIHSQGMCMLLADYYPQINEVYGDTMRDFELMTVLYNIVGGFCFNEIEYLAFTADDLTVDKLDEIVSAVMGKYPSIEWEIPSPFLITHLFESPFYYISYAVSGLSALQLYTLSQTDRNAAVDAYMRLTLEHEGQDVNEVLQSIGLKPVTDEAGIINMLEILNGLIVY